MENKTDFKPYIPADKVMPEFSVTAAVLGCVLAILFGAANAYLGLRVGPRKWRKQRFACSYWTASWCYLLRNLSGSLYRSRFRIASRNIYDWNRSFLLEIVKNHRRTAFVMTGSRYLRELFQACCSPRLSIKW